MTGPVFISGRQHSGNTMVTCIFERVPDCLAVNVEGWFFEHRGLVASKRGPAARAGYVADLLRLEDEALQQRVRDHLVAWHGEHPDADPVDVYREAMRFATEAAGRRFWVQRATSYIFYGREILELMPEARLLYLLRNPWDICASLKRRDPRKDRFAGPVLSWNRGLREAEGLSAEWPRRVLIVRYEDLVAEPAGTAAAMFEFLGVPFDEGCLDVPHVNPSEAKQARDGAARGLTTSRVGYYRDVLAPAEIAAVDLLVAKDPLHRHYPDMPPVPAGGAAARLGALGLIAVSPLRFLRQQAQRLKFQDPRWRLRRAWHRLRIWWH